MPHVLRVEEVYLPVFGELVLCDRTLTGDAGTLSVGGDGGRRETGSPSSSKLKSETEWYVSVSVTMSKAPSNRLLQIRHDRNTAQLYTHHKALQGRTSNKSEHIFHR